MTESSQGPIHDQILARCEEQRSDRHPCLHDQNLSRMGPLAGLAGCSNKPSGKAAETGVG